MLVVLEGRAAGEALGQKVAPVDAAIVGIVDHVDIEPETLAPTTDRRTTDSAPWSARRIAGTSAARRADVAAPGPSSRRDRRLVHVSALPLLVCRPADETTA